MRDGSEVKQYIEDQGYDSVVVFEDPDYAPAFIGITHDDRAAYDYNRMVLYLIEENGMSEDEAVEFISYNTIRALDYIEKGPVVIYPAEGL